MSSLSPLQPPPTHTAMLVEAMHICCGHLYFFKFENVSDFTVYFSIAKYSITVAFVLHVFSILTLHVGIGGLVKKTSCSIVGLPEYTYSRQPYPQPHGDSIGQLRRRSWWQLQLVAVISVRLLPWSTVCMCWAFRECHRCVFGILCVPRPFEVEAVSLRHIR